MKKKSSHKFKLKVYKHRYQIRGCFSYITDEYPTRLNGLINIWIKKHIEHLDIVNETFILEEIEL